MITCGQAGGGRGRGKGEEVAEETRHGKGEALTVDGWREKMVTVDGWREKRVEAMQIPLLQSLRRVLLGAVSRWCSERSSPPALVASRLDLRSDLPKHQIYQK